MQKNDVGKSNAKKAEKIFEPAMLKNTLEN